MKKGLSIVTALLIVMGLLVFIMPSQALALTEPVPASSLGIAAGSWTAGEEVDVSQYVQMAPEWLQLLTKGVKLNAAGKICHPLRGGQYGWVGEIRQLKDNKWIKLTTVNEWVPNKEGTFMSCTQAPSAGTYALFGYYIAPEVVEEVPPFDCSKVTWSSKVGNKVMIGVNVDHEVFFGSVVTGIAEGTTISYEVIASSNAALVGTKGIIPTAGGIINEYTPGISGDGLSSLQVLFTENEHMCTHTSSLLSD